MHGMGTCYNRQKWVLTLLSSWRQNAENRHIDVDRAKTSGCTARKKHEPSACMVCATQCLMEQNGVKSDRNNTHIHTLHTDRDTHTHTNLSGRFGFGRAGQVDTHNRAHAHAQVSCKQTACYTHWHTCIRSYARAHHAHTLRHTNSTRVLMPDFASVFAMLLPRRNFNT